MKEQGNAYFFLYHKNLRVTNIQHAELIALVSTHTHEATTEALVATLQFVSPADFIQTIDSLLESLPPTTTDDLPSRAGWFARTYAHLLYHTVAVETFFGSATIHLPPHLDLDLRSICGKAGYIHSCGRNVFVRNVSKATYDHFSRAVDKHMKRFPVLDGSPVFFTVFAHEDFSPHDRHRASDLRHGLDDVKIHIDKSYMGPDSLVDVVKKLRETFAGKLDVAQPEHFREKRATGSRPRTLWLISDFGVQRVIAEEGEERLDRAGRRYYICYDQLFDNQNPFQLFDENKPAWVAHTTIPHTLMGAMINITLPGWTSMTPVIADPFVGSGTTWVEATKYPHVRVISGDKSALAVRASLDNATFFTLAVEALTELTNMIRGVAEGIEGQLQHIGGIAATGRLRRFTTVTKTWMNPAAVTDDAAEKTLSTEEDYVARVLYYVALRAHRRHDQALRRSELTWQQAFATEATGLADQIDTLVDLRSRTYEEPFDDALAICTGDYSHSVTIAPSRLTALADTITATAPRRRDAESLADLAREVGGFDAIVTDPPYGFNTDENPQVLAELYRDVLRAAIRSLKNNGQLVICLPERSTIGKDPSAFTHRRIVTHQVIALAAEAGKELRNHIRAVPAPRSLFHPPYYWVSERLQRSILHFTIAERESAVST
ncbi:MAG: hypothetical protein ACSLE8_17785 [Rhodococcus sp. (in: high G+C Gram-positive bacteria)]